MKLLDLSVCLITRNEERNLPRALRSVAGLCREVVVCDTGSTDATAAIAQAAGARLLYAPWQDDFSLARNTAIQAATSAWILMLDADEELVPETAPALRAALAAPEGVLAQVVKNHLLSPEAGPPRIVSLLRLFRRDPRIRYRGRVHESIAESLLQAGATEWPDSGVHLRHHGYLEAAERKRKAARNLLLLEQAVAEDPEDLYLGFKLAQTLPQEERQRRRELAASLAQRALELPTQALQGLPFAPPLFARASEELRGAGELAQAGRICQKAAERLGGSLWFTAGQALLCAGALPAAEAALLRYLGQGQREAPLVQPDPGASPARARHLLGQVALRSGQHEPAEHLLREALAALAQGDGGDLYTAVACDLVRTWLQRGKVDAALMGLNDLCGACRPQDRGAYREAMLLSAEVSIFLKDLAGALPLCQAAVDTTGQDDRGAALLCALLLRGQPPNPSGALALMPLVPGTRYDTLAVRLHLRRLAGTGKVPAEVPPATLRALAELELP